jgi:hypothetical protein
LSVDVFHLRCFFILWAWQVSSFKRHNKWIHQRFPRKRDEKWEMTLWGKDLRGIQGSYLLSLRTCRINFNITHHEWGSGTSAKR